MTLALLATMYLTTSQQKIILQIGDVQAKKNLAQSTTTDKKLVNLLAKDKNILIRKAGLPCCNDINLLREAIDDKNVITAAAVKNPLMPAKDLNYLLSHENFEIQLLAYINPSTLQSDRMSKLNPEVARQITNITGEFVEHMVRSYELVIANSFITNSKNYWGVNVSLAIQLVGKTSSRWQTEKVSKLIEHGGIYSDLELLKRPEMSYGIAQYILENKRNREVEPSILARLVQRFGNKIMNYGTTLDKSRLLASAWLNPNIENYDLLRLAKPNYFRIPIILQDNLAHWENYLMLENQWEGDLVQRAIAATKL